MSFTTRAWIGLVAALLHILAAIHVAPPSDARATGGHPSLVVSTTTTIAIARGSSTRASTVVDRAPWSPRRGDGDPPLRALAILPVLPSVTARSSDSATFSDRFVSIHDSGVRSTARARGPPLHA